MCQNGSFEIIASLQLGVGILLIISPCTLGYFPYRVVTSPAFQYYSWMHYIKGPFLVSTLLASEPEWNSFISYSFETAIQHVLLFKIDIVPCVEMVTEIRNELKTNTVQHHLKNKQKKKKMPNLTHKMRHLQTAIANCIMNGISRVSSCNSELVLALFHFGLKTDCFTRYISLQGLEISSLPFPLQQQHKLNFLNCLSLIKNILLSTLSKQPNNLS